MNSLQTSTTNDNFADVLAHREDIPALRQEIHGAPLSYLDNGASSQMPQVVIDAIRSYQEHDHANVHRGVHTLSHRATDAFEGARDEMVKFVNAASRREIVLTSGTTESINLVAQAFARPRLKAGDRIVLTHLEHHSNIVPWQMVAEQTGAEIVVAPINGRGEVEIDQLISMLDERVGMLAIAHVSNALGTVLPVKELTEAAHKFDIPVLVDGAQAAPHINIDMQDLGCDFYALSGPQDVWPDR